MSLSEIQNKYSDIVKDFDSYLIDSKNYKATWEIRSFVNESFYEGNHRVVFDTVNKQLVTLPKTSDNEFAIGKIRKLVRGVRNMITKNDPRWHITSSRTQKATAEEKKVASALLNSIYKEEHLKDKIKDLLTHSLTKTIAWAFVGYSNDKKDVDIFIEDPFNIYTSPDGRLEGPVFIGKYMIRAVRKSLNDIKYSGLYKDGKFKDDLKQIQPSSRFAESDYKNNILSMDYQIPVDESGSAIVHELYIMHDPKFKDEDNDFIKNGVKEVTDSYSPEEDQLEHDDGRRVRIITKVGSIVIRDEITNFKQYPLLAYQPERNKGLLYSASWIEPLIQLNKAYNDGYSNRADWIEKFAKGRFLVQKGSKFSVIKGRNGQIVEYTGGKPTMMEVGHLPQEVNVHMNDTERLMEDIGGIHSESTGRLSGGELSGVAIAQLQASDNNNVSEPVDNLKTFLEELAYRILDIGSEFFNLREQDTEERTELVVGSQVKKRIEKATNSKLGKNIIEIKPLRNIEVEIVPGSAFSDMQARQDLVELRSLGVQIPDKLLIDSYKLGNAELIINEYQAEQAEQEAQKDGMEGLEAKQAELENQKLIEGVTIVPQDGENHQIHLAIHGKLLESIGQKPESQLLIQHMQSHQAMFDPSGEKSAHQPKNPNQNGQNF